MFVTGGVVSSLGKGITAASLGALLKARGLRIQVQKFDPYINVDPGTMSPFQHGEVFVTEDGAETDLDIGHYERFVDENLSRNANHTSGSIWYAVIRKERKGEYLGSTVQVIPHITNEIKDARPARRRRRRDADVVITEIGGTVGDIESLPFLEAIRQFRREEGAENVLYVHVTLVPFIDAAGELKTKPTQHSVNELRRIGIHPDIVVCRSRDELSRDIREKIALFADIDTKAVIANSDVEDVYLVPDGAARGGARRPRLREARARRRAGRPPAVDGARRANPGAPRARSRSPSSASTSSSTMRTCPSRRRSSTPGIHHGTNVRLRWVDAEGVDVEEAEQELAGADGILVPGGFGTRGIEGKILACPRGAGAWRPLPRHLPRHAGRRDRVRPATSCGLEGANSSEFDPETPYPVIDLLPEQKEIEDLGGSMRLGADRSISRSGRRRTRPTARRVVFERHRHRYEVNNHFRPRLVETGLVDLGDVPGGPARRGHRAPRPSLVRREPVPSRVQVASDAAGAALPRLRRRGATPRAHTRERAASGRLPRLGLDLSEHGLRADLPAATGLPIARPVASRGRRSSNGRRANARLDHRRTRGCGRRSSSPSPGRRTPPSSVPRTIRCWSTHADDRVVLGRGERSADGRPADG